MALMKNTLQLRAAQTQTLAMTPQLQQAIRLLQLSSLELTQEIQTAVDLNPLLEIDENADHPEAESLESLIEQENADAEFDPFDNDSSVKHNDIDGGDSFRQINADGEAVKAPAEGQEEYAETDYRGDNLSAGTRQARSLALDNDVYEGETAEDLHTHLMWQLELSPLTSMDRDIAINLIDGINDSGYLTESLEDILESLKPDYPEIAMENLLPVLKLIQHYDPLGVGARGVQECLLIQLEQRTDRHAARAREIIAGDLQLLSNRDYRSLMKKYSLKEETLKEILDLIQSLEPRPGNVGFKRRLDFVIPDVVAFKRKDGSYGVELNPHAIPAVRINENYSRLVNQARDDRERLFFKSNLQEANWFLQSIAKRNETLLKVADCIVRHQTDFMERGAAAMRPMVLNDVAQEIEMHESTISRVTTEKYIHTPKGTFELKYFFSSSLSTDSGSAASSTAIREEIRKLIAAENPRRPLSDSAIVTALNQRGIMVARRTIAKYREVLGIAPSSQRKRLI